MSRWRSKAALRGECRLVSRVLWFDSKPGSVIYDHESNANRRFRISQHAIIGGPPALLSWHFAWTDSSAENGGVLATRAILARLYSHQGKTDIMMSTLCM